MNTIFSNDSFTYGDRDAVFTSNRVGSAASGVVPDSKKRNKEVSSEFDRHHLRDHVEVGNQRRLKKLYFKRDQKK